MFINLFVASSSHMTESHVPLLDGVNLLEKQIIERMESENYGAEFNSFS